MSIELITVANYKTRYPDSALSGINNARIQSAINLAFSYLDVKTGCSISQRWPIQEPTAGYLTAEQKQYCIEAMYVETQYIISNNMDFSQGADQTSFGSLSVSSSRPNRKEVCETALMYLQKAGLYDYLSFSNMSYAGGNQSIGTIGEDEIDPTNKPLPENVSDARYVHQNGNTPNKWLKTNAEGKVIFTEYALDPTLYYNKGEINDIVRPLQTACTKLGLGYLKSISRNAVNQTITIKDELGNAITFPYGGSGGGGGTGAVNDVVVNGVSVVTAGIAEINLVDYATKLELLALLDDTNVSTAKTWSSSKIQAVFNTLSGAVQVQVVDVLPATPTNNTMYYVKRAGTNIYDIRLYVNDTLYDMGSTQLDLSNYQTKITADNKLNSDLVDDTTSTNKFVTEADKTNWNAKTSVSVSETGTSTDEVKYITVDGVEKKIGGASGNFVTLDTAQTITGFKTINTGSEGFKIQGSSYYTQLTPSGGIFDTGGSSVAFSWPSQTGQLAVISQIPSTDYLVTTNTEQDIIGLKTFTNAQGVKVGGATNYVRMVASGFDRLYMGNNYFYSFPSREGTLATNNDIATALAGYQTKIDASHKLDYSLLDNTPTIPTKTSDLTNDSNFVNQTDLQTGLATREVVGACYTKAEADTEFVDKTSTETISGLKTFSNDVQISAGKFLKCGDTSNGYVKHTNVDIRKGVDASTEYTYVLPNKSGTVALTSDIPTLGWTRTIMSGTSTRAAIFVFKNADTLIISSQDFWYTQSASTQYNAGNISSYIPSGFSIIARTQTCICNVSGASFGSVWVDTSGNLTFYSTQASPGYINFQLVVPLKKN